MHNILVSNDDGVKGPGLRPLVKELSKIGKVYVIVPKSQMSGTGHGITLAKFKRADKRRNARGLRQIRTLFFS